MAETIKKAEAIKEKKFYYSNPNMVKVRESLGYKKISYVDAWALDYRGKEDPALVLMVKEVNK